MKNNITTFNLNAFVDIIPVSVDCAEDTGTEAGACLLILVLSSVLLTPLTRRGPAVTLASEDSISKCLQRVFIYLCSNLLHLHVPALLQIWLVEGSVHSVCLWSQSQLQQQH